MIFLHFQRTGRGPAIRTHLRIEVKSMEFGHPDGVDAVARRALLYVFPNAVDILVVRTRVAPSHFQKKDSHFLDVVVRWRMP